MQHNRGSNRLPGYDYSESGYYFITICTKNRERWFGEIIDNKMILNKYGSVVKKQWKWLGKQYSYVKLDSFIIMPNHIHGVIFIKNDIKDTNVGTGRDLSLHLFRKIKPLSEIVGAFKTTSSKIIHKSHLHEFAWQRSFHDHIIRNQHALNNIRKYIRDNPVNWDKDRNNTK